MLKLRIGLVAAAFAVSATALAKGDEEPPYESPQLKALGLELEKPLLIPTLMRVTMAPFSVEMDGRVGVSAEGSSPTLGWLDAHFVSIDTAETSSDEYIDLAFLVVPPNGETGQEVETHRAERMFSKAEQSAMLGVRVWAENGCIEMNWTDSTSAAVKSFDTCVNDAGLVPTP